MQVVSAGKAKFIIFFMCISALFTISIIRDVGEHKILLLYVGFVEILMIKSSLILALLVVAVFEKEPNIPSEENHNIPKL